MGARRHAAQRGARVGAGRAVAGPPAGQPTTAGTVAPPPGPGIATDAVPLPPPVTLAATPPAAPAASPPSGRRSTRGRSPPAAVSRELDGDHAGALEDLRAAVAIETDPARRASLEKPPADAGHAPIAPVRAFVAIRLREPVRERLAAEVERLRPLAPDVAWVARDNFHLTLKFLGDVESDRLDAVTAALAGAAAERAAPST